MLIANQSFLVVRTAIRNLGLSKSRLASLEKLLTFCLFLSKALSQYPVKVTKLARGIPVGSSIEYTDEVTLSSALENRR